MASSDSLYRWVLDTQDEEEQIKFFILLYKLGLRGEDESSSPWEAARQEQARMIRGYYDSYTDQTIYPNGGRLGITCYLTPYIGCCGLYIIAAPSYGLELSYGNNNWDNTETSLYAGAGTTVCKTAAELEAQIRQTINGYVGKGPSFIITDYIRGNGKLFKFCDYFIDKDKFHMEAVGTFYNGNTGLELCTWLFKNRNIITAPQPYSSRPENARAFSQPSVYECILSGKAYL